MLRMLIAAVLLLWAAALPAQVGRSSPSVGAGETYYHRGSGMGAPPHLKDLARQSIEDHTGSGRDVIVQYGSADQRTFVTVYFYRSLYPSVPLWFEQARRSLERNTMFAGTAAESQSARTFATPNAASPDGLVVSYPLTAGQYRSTALAVTASGNWLVKLRITSSVLDEREIGERIVAAARDLRWPERDAAGATAPIAACRRSILPAQKAMAVSPALPRVDSAQVLAESLQEGWTSRICLDHRGEAMATFQELGVEDGYLLATGDAGRFARVRKVESAKGRGIYAVEFYDLDWVYLAGFFETMPSPEQVLLASNTALTSGGLARIAVQLAGSQGAQLAGKPQPAPPQAAPPKPVAPLLSAGNRRIALVIGIGSYGELGNLPNPVNDATGIAKSLRALAFDVELVIDPDQKAMRRAMSRLGERMAAGGPGSTGLFFFAGHGAQSRGINYLIPSGATLEREADLAMEAVTADAVLLQMQEAGVSTNILILDACRNMPLARQFRSAARGLAQMEAPNGSFIAYSTAPGAVAADGEGRNSPFAAALLGEISRPGQPIEVLFRNVRRAVVQATRGQQTPWDSSSLIDPFYFAAQ